jgi:hypothetical protein
MRFAAKTVCFGLVVLLLLSGLCTILAREDAQAKQVENSIVKGYVWDAETGLGIADAWVSFSDWTIGYYNSTLTNESGYYEINIPAGNFSVYASKEGYISYSYDPLTIGANETVWHNITLTPTPPEDSIVKGYVWDAETGLGIGDVSVSFSDWTIGYYNSTFTNESGYYEMNISAGNFSVYASEEGYISYSYDPLTIGPNETVWHNITLTPTPPENSIVKGYVWDAETRLGIGDVSVSFSDWTIDYWNFTFTNESGYYEMNISAGNFSVDASKEGYISYSYDPLTIGPNETVWHNITLTPIPPEVSTIKGYVLDEETGLGIAEAYVSFLDPEIDYYNFTFTNESGYYEINVSSGNFSVYAYKDGYQSYSTITPIEVGEGVVLWYNITLTPLPAENAILKGYAYRYEEGNLVPLNDTMLEVWVQGDEKFLSNWTETNATGYYELNVPAGRYCVLISARLDTYTIVNSTDPITLEFTDYNITWHNVTLILLKDEFLATAKFDGWQNLTLTGIMEFKNAYDQRRYIDYNRDGYVNATEVEEYKTQMEEFWQEDRPQTTEPYFTVDDSPYEINITTLNLTLLGFEGNVTSLAEATSIIEYNCTNLTLNESLAEHAIKCNTTYSTAWRNYLFSIDLTAIEPEGKWRRSTYEATANITIEGWTVINLKSIELEEEGREWVTITVIKDEEEPKAIVTNLTTEAGGDYVILTWSEADFADFSHYNIYWSEEPINETTLPLLTPGATTTETTYNVTSLAHKTWYFAITTVDVVNNENLTLVTSTAVPNFAPTASFTSSKTKAYVDEEITFTSTSTDPDNDTLTYLWDFGDGTTSTLQNPKHKYTKAGTYNVILTVTDEYGASHTSDILTITIEEKVLPIEWSYIVAIIIIIIVIVVIAAAAKKRKKPEKPVEEKKTE